MTENSTGRGLRSRARRQSTLTREAIEEVLYDKAYSWELVPGSDVMATTVGVLPKVGVSGDYDYYAGLVTVEATPFDRTSWALVPADTALAVESLDASSHVDYVFPDPDDTTFAAVPAGVYVAWYFVPVGSPPPYAFPEGWTPGNTTGSGPVLPLLGEDSQGYRVSAGLVHIAEGGSLDLTGDWNLLDRSVALTPEAIEAAPYVHPTTADLPGVFLAAFLPSIGTSEGPQSLPEGWTFRPYGLGPIAVTDENAGGLIGDVAYVVSGYVYNSDSPGMVRAFGHPTKYLVAEGSIDVEVGDAVYKAGGGGIASQGPGLITVAGTLTAGPDGDVNGGTATWVHYTGGGESDYWPFIERFDLANKKWLPRVPLPPAASTPDEPVWTYTNWGFSSEGATKVSYDGNNYVLIASTAEVDPTGPHPPSDVPAAWTLLGPTTFTATPYAAEGGIAGVIDGKLYFGGGDSDDITGQEFFVYDPADDSITRLADIPGDPSDIDYSPYGVVGNKLWAFYGTSTQENNARCYDTTSGQWSQHTLTASPGNVLGDQIQGFEIDGKLWFVYDGAAFVFDSVALTVTAKATWAPNASGEGTLPFYVDGKIVEFASPRSTDTRSSSYDPAHDTWAEHPADVFKIPSRADAEFASITYNGVPYLLSNVVVPSDPASNSPNSAGIYGYTGVTPSRPFTGLVTAQRIAAAQAAAVREAKPITFSVGPCTFALASNTQRAVFEAELHIPENHVITAQVHESVAFGGILISVYRLNADGSFAGTGNGYTAIFDHGTALVDLWPVGLFTSALSAESAYDDLITDPDNPGYVKNVGAGGLFHVRLEVLNLRRI